MQRSPWRLLAALLLTVVAAACGDVPTATPGAEPAQLGISLNLSNTSAASVSVQVTAGDITQPLVFNIPVSNGTATGSIAVPPGSARTITVRAFNAQGAKTHEGSTTVDVRPGTNPPVTVTLLPQAGEVPIVVEIASVFIQVQPTTYPNWSNGYAVGTVAGFQAQVVDNNGNPIPGAQVRWASLDPGVMSVDASGNAHANGVGTTEIVATWNGYAGSYRASVASGPSDGVAPRLDALSFDRTSVRYTGTAQTVWLRFSITEETSGIWMVDGLITSLSNGTSYPCHARPTGTRGVWECGLIVDAWMPLGEYVVSEANVVDTAGNGYNHNAPDLEQRGLAARFSVIP